MLQGKSATINYKNKKQIEKDKRDWVKVEDTHEGIISKEVFYIANRMLKRDFYNTKEKKTDLFGGMLFCKDCNSPLVRRVVKYKEKEQVFYICSKYNKEKSCSRHSIKEETLIKAMSKIIKSYIEFNEKLYSKVQLIDINRNLKDNQIPILKREKAKKSLRPGQSVEVTSFGQRGTLVEKISEQEWVVQMGIIKMKMPVEDLISIEEEPSKPTQVIVKSHRSSHVSTELDLRGKRYEEAIKDLELFLDAALLAGYPRVTIIHGRGTGAIQQGVHKTLKKHRSVASYEFAPMNMGGNGATVVLFK